MFISTINNNVNTNLSYKDFIRGNDGKLKLKPSQRLINKPIKNWTLDSFSSRGIR